jgi:hypothetical protein
MDSLQQFQNVISSTSNDIFTCWDLSYMILYHILLSPMLEIINGKFGRRHQYNRRYTESSKNNVINTYQQQYNNDNDYIDNDYNKAFMKPWNDKREILRQSNKLKNNTLQVAAVGFGRTGTVR